MYRSEDHSEYDGISRFGEWSIEDEATWKTVTWQPMLKFSHQIQTRQRGFPLMQAQVKRVF